MGKPPDLKVEVAELRDAAAKLQGPERLGGDVDLAREGGGAHALESDVGQLALAEAQLVPYPLADA